MLLDSPSSALVGQVGCCLHGIALRPCKSDGGRCECRETRVNCTFRLFILIVLLHECMPTEQAFLTI